MKTSLAVVALVATAIGLATALPAFSQTAPAVAITPAASPDQGAPYGMRDGGMRHHMAGMNRGMGPGGIFMLACSDRGAEALEVALVRMSHRLQLTADQQKLFDTFRAKALTTETSFADNCKAGSVGTPPDLLARLKAGLAVDQARITAMTDVLPDFEAFYNSLSDQQKASFLPHRDRGTGRDVGRQGDHGDMGRNGAHRHW